MMKWLKGKHKMKIKFVPVSTYTLGSQYAEYYTVLADRLSALGDFLRERGEKRAEELKELATKYYKELVKDANEKKLTGGEVEVILSTLVATYITNTFKNLDRPTSETPYLIADSIHAMVIETLLSIFEK